jgi:outer membrane protein OmpA-like peptidoglycan-associated protein
MNSIIASGIATFLIWSAFSSWYYACQIRGLCGGEQAVVVEQIIEEEVPQPEIIEEVVTDSVTEELPPVELTETGILFALNSSQVTNEGLLNELVREAIAQLEGRNFEVTINGYTCDLGSEDYNSTLSEKRAQNVASAIRNSALNPKDMNVMGRGESDPRFPNDSEENRRKNRRVEVTFKSIEP